ncbi:cubilin-like [Leptidea sinapis]|uniref:cubilin-like n=1 Tax=Leptidea sinapis TaxID=189913 RepID=UPI0021C384B4|nr:cubilin-like [Leptidea sinapis]
MNGKLVLILAVIVCSLWFTECCEPDQAQYGCKFSGTTCTCGNGCKTEYIYRTRRACLNALREKNSNVCFRMPCVRGTCIQTAQDSGYTCKCEGTGYYGQRCEKACPTIQMRGLLFPHECVVI